MSTLSGIFPNAITPSVNLPVDPEQQAQLRRQKEAAVFSPVDQSEATAPSQNRSGDRSARQASQNDARPVRQPEVESESTATGRPSEAKTNGNNDGAQRSESTESADRTRESGVQDAEQSRADDRRLEDELQTIRELAQRDREVRNHEQAHQAVGGQYAGGMSLTYTTGPDGKRYAVAGEVSIDISPVPGNPEATMDKAERVRRAALAPAEPSNQDRAVAAQATQLQVEAQAEMREMEREARVEAEQQAEEARSSGDGREQGVEGASQGESAENEARRQSDEESQDRQEQLFDTSRDVTSRALVIEQYRETGNSPGVILDYIV